MVRLIVQTAVWLATTAALLFVPAGTLRWPAAWVMLAELGVVALSIGAWLARHDPELLRERLSSAVQREQPAWDRLLMSLLVALWSGWFVVMGLDVRHHGISQIPIVARSWVRSAFPPAHG